MTRSEQRLYHQALEYIGKNWSKASLTRQKLLQNIRSLAKHMAGQGLQHISHMKSKHIERYFAEMKDKGLAGSTLQNHATAARVLAKAIGKANIVPSTNAALNCTRGDRYKPIIPNNEKLAVIREQLGKLDQRLLAAHDMREAFGLRAKESIVSKSVCEIDGRKYLIVEGAKGGRPRLLEISAGMQEQAIAQVHKIIAEQGTKSIVPETMTLKAFYHYQKNTLFALGARRNDGSSMHSLRHGYAQAERAKGKTNGAIQRGLGHGESRTQKHYMPE